MAKFFQLAPPDLAGLGLGTATFESMQALGFSADGTLLLVKISFTDDGEPTLRSKYATYVYDLADEKYIANLNDLLGPDANVTQVQNAYIVGSRASWEVVANVDILNSNSQVLKSYSSTGEIVNNLIVAEATDLAHLTSSSEIEVENFQLTDDGRYLAVQTSSNLLAVNASDDVNQSSDIYLIDRDNGSVARVSFQGGIGKDDAVYLADVTKRASQLKVAFVTDQYFSTKDKNSIDVELNGSIEGRNDLYLASTDIDLGGRLSEFTFDLLSVDADGYATGFVDIDSDSLPKITEKGVYFSSDSFSLVSGDNNESKDVFISTGTTIERVQLSGIDELFSGADFVGASKSGKTIYIKTSSAELSGSPGVDQFVKVSLTDPSYQVVSNNDVQADNIVINGSVSPGGGSLAFTSLASNIVPTDQTLGVEYDLYVFTDADEIPLFQADQIETGIAGAADTFTFANTTDPLGKTLIQSFNSTEDRILFSGFDYTKIIISLDSQGDDRFIFSEDSENNSEVKVETNATPATLNLRNPVSQSLKFIGEDETNVTVSSQGIIEPVASFASSSVKITNVTDLKTQIKKIGDSVASDPINLSDVLAQLKHIIGLRELKANALQAGDTNNDGEVDLSDVLNNLKHIIGLRQIDTFDLVTDNGFAINALDSDSKGNLTLVINGDADQSHADWDIA